MSKVVKMPKFEPVTQENMIEALFNWYRSLGWNGKDELDPKRIIISHTDWSEICKQYINAGDSRGGLFFMNYSPSSDEFKEEKVKPGTVLLKDGWVREGVLN
jgi:hypothetical protein